MPGREVRLVVLDVGGAPAGVAGPFRVGSPWWPDAEPVVAAARGAGLELVVLRLLPGLSTPGHGEPGPTGPTVGGRVTYLAQLLVPATSGALGALDAVLDDDALAAVLADHPLRVPWARPGGPQAVVAWADGVLAAAGRPRTGPAQQVKSWNLSSVLRLPTADGPVWCKSVPPFFAHEGPVLRRVAGTHPGLVPPVLGHDPATGSVLLGDLPGQDQWAAPASRLVQMVEATVDLQAGWAGRDDELLALGLPDWRGEHLLARLYALVARADVGSTVDDDDLAALDTGLARLAAPDGLLRRLEDCGVPDTLVHGDLHPGNWRHGPDGLRLLDWGDCGVGHPLLDQPAFLSRLPADAVPVVRAAWAGAWRDRVPGADAARAAELVAPLAALRQALVYRTFLDHLEPDEHVYHRDDVPSWLRQARAELDAQLL